MRPLAVGEKPGSAPKAPPPAFVLKLLVRVHPELRRRAKTAEQAFARRRWREEVDQWFDHDREAQLAQNRALQAVDPHALDDAELAAHVATTLSHFERSARRNLATHGGDLMPTGDLLAHCDAWGISTNEAAGLLTGSSPATVETAVLLSPVARAIGAVGCRSRHSRRSTTCADSAPTRELPSMPGSSCTCGARSPPTMSTGPHSPRFRSSSWRRCSVRPSSSTSQSPTMPQSGPASLPSTGTLFDELLVEARYGHRQREDIRGLCWNWPCGLVRRALLEAGRRLHAAGRVHQVEHVVELFPDEFDRVVRGGDGPSADELADRSTERDRIEATPPPRVLGEPEPAPPLDAFPEAMARATAALMANLGADATPRSPTPTLDGERSRDRHHAISRARLRGA
jgi:rifampicin phosphotransferase